MGGSRKTQRVVFNPPWNFMQPCKDLVNNKAGKLFGLFVTSLHNKTADWPTALTLAQPIRV